MEALQILIVILSIINCIFAISAKNWFALGGWIVAGVQTLMVISLIP